ncbi:unnamed protein product [Symbiodinium natans]|uniref:Glycosyltransferase family 18 catalytic domain-containing protein n=1 Tax=Symbiodinium natans TaxID=878477 RepID=A0A812PTR9_9DINO|nr:unnamed protein product [Symbiodinium natans]
MWNKMLTSIDKTGFEISAKDYSSNSRAIDGWHGSSGHRAVMRTSGMWTNLKAIGCGKAERIYNCWFMETTSDPLGECNGTYIPTTTSTTTSVLGADYPWVKGRLEESCDDACARNGKICTPQNFAQLNQEVDSNAEMRQVLSSLGVTCQSFYADAPEGALSPAWSPSNGNCILSGKSRPESTFRCQTKPNTWRRLCACISNFTSSNNSSENDTFSNLTSSDTTNDAGNHTRNETSTSTDDDPNNDTSHDSRNDTSSNDTSNDSNNDSNDDINDDTNNDTSNSDDSGSTISVNDSAESVSNESSNPRDDFSTASAVSGDFGLAGMVFLLVLQPLCI